MTTTYLVNSTDDFHKYYPILKEDACRGDSQKVFVVGIDTEFICQDNYPESFLKSSEWVEDNSCKMVVCVLQIASANVCMVINLVKMGKLMPDKLKKIITSDSWVKLGIGVENDLKILSSNYNLGYCGGALELKNIAIMALHPKPNLEFLYNQFVGGHVKKTNSVHDWTTDFTGEQIMYAARDAIMSYQLGTSMLEPTLDVIKSKVEIDTSSKLEIIIDNQEVDTKKPEVSKINHVGRLQEYAQKLKIPLPEYTCVNSTERNPSEFEVVCKFSTYNDTIGHGHNKKSAKTHSAKLMMEQIKM